jgi:pyrroline-5-carboxylate reductase
VWLVALIVPFFFTVAALHMSKSIENVGKNDLTQLSLGFLGCGKISSAMIRGYCSQSPRPRRVFVTRRSEEKSRLLQEEFPDLVEVSDSAEYVAAQSDVLFVGLLPGGARELLPTLSFGGKYVVSMMAAVNFDEVLSLTRVPAARCLKIVPLPSSARREGPIVAFPKTSPVDFIVKTVGTMVSCDTELQMKPMVAITGHISPFFELMRTTQSFLLSKGISEEMSHDYVAAFYAGLASGAAVSDHSFEGDNDSLLDE